MLIKSLYNRIVSKFFFALFTQVSFKLLKKGPQYFAMPHPLFTGISMSSHKYRQLYRSPSE